MAALTSQLIHEHLHGCPHTPLRPSTGKLAAKSNMVSTQARIPPPVNLLQMCCNFQEVRQLHALFVVSGLLHCPTMAARLLQAYVNVSQIRYALSVFNTIPSPNVFASNTMMRGLALHKNPCGSFLLFDRFLNNGGTPDNYTYTSIILACSQLKALPQGRQVHAQVIKVGIRLDTHIHSSLIYMYMIAGSTDCAKRILSEFSEENTLAKNSIISGYMSQGHVEEARTVFSSMAAPARDVASWSAMISGYTKNDMYMEALNVYQKMMIFQVFPNESALVSSLSACSHLGALDQGRWIHAYINRSGIKISTIIGTALVEMYAKCGSIRCGYDMFLEMAERDVVTWGVMISGFALHGQAQKCKQLFDEMIATGTHPNGVIFVSLLSACSHAGFVELGYHYFQQMLYEFGIRPSIEHYGCLVDLLSRAGLLAEAEDLILRMPKELNPSSIIWGALLRGCRTYNDMRRGSCVFRHLIELEQGSGDRYKLGCDLMLANGGEKIEVARIRKVINENNLHTTLGKSFIEVEGVVHEFTAGDINHKEAEVIYRTYDGG